MPIAPTPAARRSCLSVPGSSASMLAKAPQRGADEVVIDLEDAVATSAKDAARETVVAVLREPSYQGVRTSVRVNAPRTPWCHSDVIAMASFAQGPDSIIVPKVERAGDLEFIDRLLDGVEAAARSGHAPMRVQALIETAAGVAHLDEIAGASPRLDALILGYADLSASLGRAAGWTPGARSRMRSSSPRAPTTSPRSTGRTSASPSTPASPPRRSVRATWASTASGRSIRRRSSR
jgi:citrate lyase subunit beta/citryl-CoA lyase